MDTTIRFHNNPKEANLDHNERGKSTKYAAHIRQDAGYTHKVLIDRYRTADAAIRDTFQKALDEYNEGKKPSRQKTMEQFIDDIRNDARGKKTDNYHTPKPIVHELVLSVGNVTTKATNPDGSLMLDSGGHYITPMRLPDEVSEAVLTRYTTTFETRNPQLKIVRADIHNDEAYKNKITGVIERGTMHEHLAYMPVANGYKQGVKIQPSIGKALNNMGFFDTICRDEQNRPMKDKDGRTVVKCAYEYWQERERAEIWDILQDEYQKYCQLHPDYYKSHGDLVLLHPDEGKTAEETAKMNNPEVFKAVNDAQTEYAQLKPKINAINHLAAVTKRERTQLKDRETQLDERETDLNEREYRVRRRETDADKRKKSLDDRETELNERETRVQQYEEQTLKWADNYTDAVKEELEEEKKKLLEEFQQQLDEKNAKAAANRRKEYLQTINDLYAAYNEFKQDAEREFTSIQQKSAFYSKLDKLTDTAEKKMQSAAAPQKTDEYQK